MRKIFFIAIMLGLFSNTAFANTFKDTKVQENTTKILGCQTDSSKRENLGFLKSSALSDPTEAEKRGCCSWHNGVCGCSSSGAVMCCDGTQSPSCRC